jgi:hypothetical protein
MFIPQPAGRLKLRRRHNGQHWTWVCVYTEAYADILCGSARTWDDAVAMGLRALALREQP